MALAKNVLSFRTIFQKYGRLFVQEFQRNILSQKGIDGAGFVPSKGSVTKVNYGKKGKTRGQVTSKSGTHPRLLVTGKTEQNAYQYRADDTSLTLYVNEGQHDKRASYSDIIYYNNKPTSENPKSPLVFPTSEPEMAMTETMQTFIGEIEKEAEEFFSQYNVNLTTVINVGAK
jgi:hypothetical protein